jgi:hypothetical protein
VVLRHRQDIQHQRGQHLHHRRQRGLLLLQPQELRPHQDVEVYARERLRLRQPAHLPAELGRRHCCKPLLGHSLRKQRKKEREREREREKRQICIFIF